MYVIFSSYGNDSVALIQWAYESGLNDVHVVFSDTGWAADFWHDRVASGERWAKSLGFMTWRTKSEGMAELLRRKKGWPRGGGGKYQFCTGALKIEPGLNWLNEQDPEGNATCMNAKRRCESTARLTTPEWVTESDAHGGRELWSPLVRHTDNDRNELVSRTPMQLLPFKSKECWPCVNATPKELKHLEPERIDLIEVMEEEAGTNSLGNKRVMFSPARHHGAVGIREVVEEAKKDMDDLVPVRICSTGWCG